jgi:pimeloyl-ACP methyl ester carboxylesterase
VPLADEATRRGAVVASPPVLPDKGPPHPYYDFDDAFTEVTFDDDAGAARTVRVRHKTLGDGPPLVLVHGLMTSSYSWRYVMDPLAKRYRVFVPDLVGAGASEKPTDLVYSVANVARFLTAYVRSVSKDAPYLVGNSLGGLYCVRALQLGLEARRFVLMHSPGYPFVRTRLLNVALGAPGLPGLVARVAHKWPEIFVAKNVHYARNDILSREECKEYGRIFHTLDGARVFARILAESLDPKEHAAIVSELKQRGLACPTRLFFAKKDVMVPPSFGPLYQADIPGSELVWFEDASHFLQVDAPERTVDAVLAFDT